MSILRFVEKEEKLKIIEDKNKKIRPLQDKERLQIVENKILSTNNILFYLKEELHRAVDGMAYPLVVVVTKGKSHYWESSHDSDHYGYTQDPDTETYENDKERGVPLSSLLWQEIDRVDINGTARLSTGRNETYIAKVSTISTDVMLVNHLSTLDGCADTSTYKKYLKSIEMSKISCISSTRIREIKEYESAFKKWVKEDFTPWTQPVLKNKYFTFVEEYNLFSEESQDEVILKVISEVFGMTLDDFNDDWVAENERGKAKVIFGENYSFKMEIEGDVRLGSMGLNRLGLKKE